MALHPVPRFRHRAVAEVVGPSPHCAVPSTDSAAVVLALFVGFVGTTGLSDCPPSFIAGVRRWALPARPVAPSATGEAGLSRFSRKKLPYVRRVSDRAGLGSGSRCRGWPMWPSASHNGVGAPECPISRLNTAPVRAPVNASPPLSRVAPHDSGSSWVADPSM